MAASWCQPLSVILGKCSRASIGIQPKKKTSRVDKILSYLKNEEKLQELVPIHRTPVYSVEEPEQIRDGLGLSSTYCMVRGRSHFFKCSSEILNAVIELSTFK